MVDARPSARRQISLPRWAILSQNRMLLTHCRIRQPRVNRWSQSQRRTVNGEQAWHNRSRHQCQPRAHVGRHSGPSSVVAMARSKAESPEPRLPCASRGPSRRYAGHRRGCDWFSLPCCSSYSGCIEVGNAYARVFRTEP